MNRRSFLTAATASVLASSVKDIVPTVNAESWKPDTAKKPHHPNVILMICDDLGYGDLGCSGGKLETPNLDQLAREGVLLTHCNTAHPTCSAARAALLTGRYASRVGVSRVFFPADKTGMQLGTPTIATMLKEVGYQTTALGKWHLGQEGNYLPPGFGFDDYLGVAGSVDMTPLPLLDGTKVVEEEADRDMLTPRYTERAIGRIKAAKGNPFFIYLAFSYPHIPIHASPAFRGKSKHGLYGDSVMEIDWSVGQIRKTLKERGLEENTLIMFTSDHGPWYQGDPGRLKGRKNTNYEGGVRVPFIAAWKGQLPANRRAEAFISTTDVLPIVARVCNAKHPDVALDGVDEWAVLTGQSKDPKRDGIVLYTSGDDLNIHCARLGEWKLRFAAYDAPPYVFAAYPRHSYTLPRPELYNLREDPTESYDVASAHPELVENMLKKVDEAIQTFPEDVQKAYAKQKGLVGNAHMSAGALPISAAFKLPVSMYDK